MGLSHVFFVTIKEFPLTWRLFGDIVHSVAKGSSLRGMFRVAEPTNMDVLTFWLCLN